MKGWGAIQNDYTELARENSMAPLSLAWMLGPLSFSLKSQITLFRDLWSWETGHHLGSKEVSSDHFRTQGHLRPQGPKLRI